MQLRQSLLILLKVVFYLVAHYLAEFRHQVLLLLVDKVVVHFETLVRLLVEEGSEVCVLGGHVDYVNQLALAVFSLRPLDFQRTHKFEFLSLAFFHSGNFGGLLQVEFVHDFGQVFLHFGVEFERLEFVYAALYVAFFLIGGLLDESGHDGLHVNPAAHVVDDGGEHDAQLVLLQHVAQIVEDSGYVVELILDLLAARVFSIEVLSRPVVHSFKLFLHAHAQILQGFLLITAHAHEEPVVDRNLALLGVRRVELR
mmetsp:Transcript_13925/g.30165  ORF Transcript_13925/g.30165 Transcript_13925/m.30165 type:complete len:255 (-) Transcript_13925:1365-2129(-)